LKTADCPEPKLEVSEPKLEVPEPKLEVPEPKLEAAAPQRAVRPRQLVSVIENFLLRQIRRALHRKVR
jgi:hypothetical protein